MKSPELSPKLKKNIKELDGPILILGAGGFIGINLLNFILLYRKDVFGVSLDYINNWRFVANNTHLSHLINCDVTEPSQVIELIKNLKPKTIFNLAAYGAYSRQKEYNKIYATNFNATVTIIETLKKYNFSVYIHAGSSSEYGLNSACPKECDELIPNTHYSVSKVSSYFLLKYYGKVEKLPVIHLRIYSAFGPWEEPDRLFPVLLSHARKGLLPPLVNQNISRDYIYISDVCSAFILSANKLKKKYFGEAFNVGTGKRTTIKELVDKVKSILEVDVNPEFSSMPNRAWDLTNWYADNQFIRKELKWEQTVSLEEGIKLTIQWQQEIDFDNALWNWTKRK